MNEGIKIKEPATKFKKPKIKEPEYMDYELDSDLQYHRFQRKMEREDEFEELFGL